MKKNDSQECRNCHHVEAMEPEKQTEKARARHAKAQGRGHDLHRLPFRHRAQRARRARTAGAEGRQMSKRRAPMRVSAAAFAAAWRSRGARRRQQAAGAAQGPGAQRRREVHALPRRERRRTRCSRSARRKHGTRADTRTPTCTSCHGESETPHEQAGGREGAARSPTARSARRRTTPIEARNEACLTCHQGGKRIHWQMQRARQPRRRLQLLPPGAHRGTTRCATR